MSESSATGRRIWMGRVLAGVGAAAVGWPREIAAQACAPTEPNIEGPFHRPGAPWRADLRAPGELGTPLVVGGRVLDSRCSPLSGAVLDVWHADARGEYDLRGYAHRGQLRTDAQGRFALSTIVPGRYRNGPTYRPAHVHVKVHATGRPVLTTQLYFPGDPENDSDPWIRPSLIMPITRVGPELRGRFDFVV